MINIRKTYWLFILLLIVSSCTKEKTVWFHGKMTLCDGTPLSNIPIHIVRDYYSGHDDIQSIGTTTTDAKGEYSLLMEVSLPGSNGWYRIFYSDTTHLYHGTYQTDVSDIKTNIQTDFTLANFSIAKCHIKNLSPVNGNDVLDSLTYYENALYRHVPVVYNLTGTSVDTIILVNIKNSIVDMEYTFTKDGITTVLKDTITPACNDTAYMDIFY